MVAACPLDRPGGEGLAARLTCKRSKRRSRRAAVIAYICGCNCYPVRACAKWGMCMEDQ